MLVQPFESLLSEVLIFYTIVIIRFVIWKSSNIMAVIALDFVEKKGNKENKLIYMRVYVCITYER